MTTDAEPIRKLVEVEKHDHVWKAFQWGDGSGADLGFWNVGCDECSAVLAIEVQPEDAALIVAEHNALPILLNLLRERGLQPVDNKTIAREAAIDIHTKPEHNNTVGQITARIIAAIEKAEAAQWISVEDGYPTTKNEFELIDADENRFIGWWSGKQWHCAEFCLEPDEVTAYMELRSPPTPTGR